MSFNVLRSSLKFNDVDSYVKGTYNFTINKNVEKQEFIFIL